MPDDVNPKRRSKRAAASPEAAADPIRAAPPRGEPAPDPIDADTLDEAFVKALEQDFILYGKSAIEAMRSDKPVEYMKIVAALRTKETTDAANPLREMSDDELRRHFKKLAASAGFEVRFVGACGGGHGAEAPPDAE